jgi:hypothetical protein
VRLSRTLSDETLWQRSFSDSLRYLAEAIQLQGPRILIQQKRRGTLAYYRNGFSRRSWKPAFRRPGFMRRCKNTHRRKICAFGCGGNSSVRHDNSPAPARGSHRFLDGLNRVQTGWVLSLVADLVKTRNWCVSGWQC